MQSNLVNVPISAIRINPLQPRSDFDPAMLKALSASIEKFGIIEPLVLKDNDNGTYTLIAGERRLRASMDCGLKEVPAVIRNPSDSEMLEIALIENILREDISPIDKAKGFKRLMSEFGLTQIQISNTFGISRSSIANTIRILYLPDIIKKSIHERRISEGHARAILFIKDREEQIVFHNKIVCLNLSVREAESFAKKISKQIKGRKNDRSSSDSYKDVDLISMLQERLGTKVRIIRNDDQGKIEIEFYSEEDLKRITDSL